MTGPNARLFDKDAWAPSCLEMLKEYEWIVLKMNDLR